MGPKVYDTSSQQKCFLEQEGQWEDRDGAQLGKGRLDQKEDWAEMTAESTAVSRFPSWAAKPYLEDYICSLTLRRL